MPAEQKAEYHYFALLPGILTILLGSVALIGWIITFPLLTRINSEWAPMVPSTALCFILSGLSLLKCRRFLDHKLSSAQRIIVWLILLLSGAKIIELVSGHEFGIDYLGVPWLEQPGSAGHMSPQTTFGFLAFALGLLANQRASCANAKLLARILAAVLLALGLSVVFGYSLNFHYVFEAFYIWTGLVWMSLPTAIGMTLLGIGLWSYTYRVSQDTQTPETKLNAVRINRATLIVVATTSITTAVVGLRLLDEAVIAQASSSFMQTLNASRASIAGELENRTQRALVVSLEPSFKLAATALLRNGDNKSAMAQANRLAEPLLTHGFSGFALESAGRNRVIAGHLLPSTIPRFRLNGENDASLVWNNGYFLRLRVPIAAGNPKDFMVFEQSLPYLNKIFDDNNHWGETGAMPMCARLNKMQLLCFPQREQSGMYVIPDTIDGKPIPMTYALAGQSDIKSLIDYRGHHVLSAYGPLAACLASR